MTRTINRCGISPRLGLLALLGWLTIGAVAQAAYTEPRLALTRAHVLRASSGTVSLRLSGTFSFADLLQLSLPVNVFVTQANLTARLDQSGNSFTTLAPGPEQPAAGLGVVSLTESEILVVLPTGFNSGSATVRVVITYDGDDISTNQLAVIL